MAWDANVGVQAQNLLGTLTGNLTDHGWSLADRAEDRVYTSLNNQGVQQYIQLTMQPTGTSTYQYIQLQGWRSWATGTHTGSDASLITYQKIYFSASPISATSTVDLYQSTTANRCIFAVCGPGGWRNWAYFGGLDALAGVNDPFCFAIASSNNAASSYNLGVILGAAAGAATWWPVLYLASMAFYTSADAQGVSALYAGIVGRDVSQQLLCPVMVVDGVVPYCVRGNLDGLKYAPSAYSGVGHLDTVVMDGVTYLIVIPGGRLTTNQSGFTGLYTAGLAIAEV